MLALNFCKTNYSGNSENRMYILAKENRYRLSKKSYLMLEHVVLKFFNIWNNMSKKMSYEGAFDIAPAELD